MNNSVLAGLTYVSILGVRVHSISLDHLLDFITQNAESGRKVVIANVNVHALNLAYQDSWFRGFLNCSDLVFCDGFGVSWAAKFLSDVRLYRYTPPDWFPLLGQNCAKRGLSMFLLGAKPGVVERAANALQQAAPGLKIVGTHHGYFDSSPASHEQHTLIGQINFLKPDILVVGFGMPLQEKWIDQNKDQLDTMVFIPVGAMFDYLAGETARAPRWMTDHGLEWLGRLIIEPKRLWKRYVIGNPLFILRVLAQKYHCWFEKL